MAPNHDLHGASFRVGAQDSSAPCPRGPAFIPHSSYFSPFNAASSAAPFGLPSPVHASQPFPAE